MDVMPVKQHNHHCIVCGTGYHYCNDCNKIASFTPWRKIACSNECYQAHLAYIEYRDITHDAKRFAELIDFCGIDVGKMHQVLKEAYACGIEERNAVVERTAEEATEIEVADKDVFLEERASKVIKARRK